MRKRIGVSACLLGEKVRWDGRDKLDGFVAGLAAEFELIPVCPEVEVGLGVPRDPIQIEQPGSSGTRLRNVITGEDLTERMEAFARARVEALAALGLSGYVLKSRSPSCGRVNVPIHKSDGTAEESGVGFFAREVLARLGDIPVEDEASLADPEVRTRFLERVRRACR
jgi:uncharacterized protein YbbK (DUF523 family)